MRGAHAWVRRVPAQVSSQTCACVQAQHGTRVCVWVCATQDCLCTPVCSRVLETMNVLVRLRVRIEEA